MKSQIEDPEKLANKLDHDDKESITEALDEANSWLRENDHHSEAVKEDFDEQMRQVKSVCDPIVSKLYQGGNQ